MSAPSSGSLVVAPRATFDGVKIFTATMMQDRARLGDLITAWIASNPQMRVTEFVVTQSSDSQFHCITISVFYAGRS